MPAELLAFPLDRLAGRARHVAAMIDKRRGKDRDVYFRTICKQLADRLRRNGLPELVVHEQIGLFTSAVNRCVSEGWHFERPVLPSDEPDFFDHGGAA